VTKWIVLVVYAVIGWGICGATIGIGRQIMSMDATLWVHAVVAPLAFGLLARHYSSRHVGVSPAQTALGLLGVVIALDAFLVAPFLERSYAMFQSVLGTWVPFASILVASYLASRTVRRRSGAPQGRAS
jgi:hypothetical protein